MNDRLWDDFGYAGDARRFSPEAQALEARIQELLALL